MILIKSYWEGEKQKENNQKSNKRFFNEEIQMILGGKEIPKKGKYLVWHGQKNLKGD